MVLVAVIIATRCGLDICTVGSARLPRIVPGTARNKTGSDIRNGAVRLRIKCTKSWWSEASESDNQMGPMLLAKE